MSTVQFVNREVIFIQKIVQLCQLLLLVLGWRHGACCLLGAHDGIRLFILLQLNKSSLHLLLVILNDASVLNIHTLFPFNI